METQSPEKIPIGIQILLLFVPLVAGILAAQTMKGYDGLFALLWLTLGGALAAGIWTGVRMISKDPENTTGGKVIQFITGLLVGAIAYIGIAWLGCTLVVKVI